MAINNSNLPLENVTLRQLINWRTSLRKINFDKNLFNIETQIAYLFSIFTLHKFFGIEWCEKFAMLRSIEGIGLLDTNTFGDPWQVKSMAAKKGDFLKTFTNSFNEQAEHQVKIIDLAEMLFNLQLIEGTSELFEFIYKGELESNFAVLLSAKILLNSGNNFRFVTRKGKLGEDYDAEIFNAEGSYVCCEMKCKLTSTHFSVQTILSTLKDAKKQFPKDLYGIIFLSFPQRWLLEENFVSNVNDTMKEFFRNTSRILSVILYIDEWQYFGRKTVRIYNTFELQNPYIKNIGSNFYGLFNISIMSNTEKYFPFLNIEYRQTFGEGYFLVPLNKDDYM